jgi:GcrA cell cycle regulator
MPNWTVELISELVQLWTQGKTLTEIAGRYGLTRSTISGKLYRLGLLHRGKPGKPASTPHHHHHRRRPPRVKPAAAIHIEADVPAKQKPFIGLWIDELGPGDCRYPRDDQVAAPYQFCGQPTRFGSSYCGFHFERCCNTVSHRKAPTYDLAARGK